MMRNKDLSFKLRSLEIIELDFFFFGGGGVGFFFGRILMSQCDKTPLQEVTAAELFQRNRN